jgi:hypothetical protein
MWRALISISSLGRNPELAGRSQRAAEAKAPETGKFTRAHVANAVGCLPAILFASAIWS